MNKQLKTKTRHWFILTITAIALVLLLGFSFLFLLGRHSMDEVKTHLNTRMSDSGLAYATTLSEILSKLNLETTEDIKTAQIIFSNITSQTPYINGLCLYSSKKIIILCKGLNPLTDNIQFKHQKIDFLTEKSHVEKWDANRSFFIRFNTIAPSPTKSNAYLLLTIKDITKP